MKFLTIDFETFYSNDYSLSKMSTEDYVNDPRFEVILVGVKVNDEPPTWFSGTMKQTKAWLDTFDIPNSAVNAHNNMFDGLILAVHFGLIAKMYCDTMLMAQAVLKPYVRSISLDSCLKNIDVGILKGHEVHNMLGRTRDSLSRDELKRYAEYCLTDCEGEYRLFKYFAGLVQRTELQVIDITLRMYIQPCLQLDANLLAEQLQEVKAKAAQTLASLPEGIDISVLRSNEKFADALRLYGIDPPLKISPATGLTTYAFAKTDTGWKELEESCEDHEELSVILAARMSAKSTLAEARTQRLLDIAMRYKLFRVPLMYYAAHTGRYGGTQGINVQNFPRIDKSKMRYCIRAPKGYVIIGADLSQIEARITAWLAKQKNLLTGFRNKEDIYSAFASVAFKIDTKKGRSKEDDLRRFCGKTCILGLGFGMSAARLKATLRKDGVKLTLQECQLLVDTYRTMYGDIPALWGLLDRYITYMAKGNVSFNIGPCTIVDNTVILPNEMSLVYNNLRYIQNEKYRGYVYNFAGETRTMWGGKLTENIVQALARILIMEYMLKIKEKLGLLPALQVHDELDYVVRAEHADKVAQVLAKLMRVPPTWAPDLPVDVEVNYGETFGDCK